MVCALVLFQVFYIKIAYKSSAVDKRTFKALLGTKGIFECPPQKEVLLKVFYGDFLPLTRLFETLVWIEEISN